MDVNILWVLGSWIMGFFIGWWVGVGDKDKVKRLRLEKLEKKDDK